METNIGTRYTGERAQFMAHDTEYINCIFADGESPLKHAGNVKLCRTSFQWKYPLWYANNIKISQCSFLDMARAGIWYSNGISLEETVYEAPKGFRRVNGLSLKEVDIPHAEETLWNCDNVTIDDVAIRGDYFAMNCKNMQINNLRVFGNYCFDGCENITITNSKLLSKDAFWNCKNVTVKNCYITGEYLAWNSENVTFIDCVIESLQGLCYIKNLKLRGCTLINTTYAFEYSQCDVEVSGKIDSVLNPSGGVIRAEEIGNLIIAEDMKDKTRIECEKIDKLSTEADWK